MASPVGHSLIGFSLFLWASPRLKTGLVSHVALFRNKLIAFIILAILPDLDFLFSWMISGDPNRYHRNWTHSLLFAIITAGVFAFIVRIDPDIKKNGFFGFLAVGSHSVIDFFTGPTLGVTPSYGIPWLIPFSTEQLISPVTIFVGPHHQNFEQLFSFHNWWWAFVEALVLAPFVWLIWIKRRRKN